MMVRSLVRIKYYTNAQAIEVKKNKKDTQTQNIKEKNMKKKKVILKGNSCKRYLEP